MNETYLQLVIEADIPFALYFSNKQEDKISFYEATSELIALLNYIDSKKENGILQLVIPPLFFELTELEDFKNEITEFLEKNKGIRVKEYEYWNHIDKELNKSIKILLEQNKMELLASPISYIPLPYLSTEFGVNFQVEYGLFLIKKYFDYQTTGFWFPFDAYTPGLDLHIKNAGIQYSFINSNTVRLSDPFPTEKGVAVQSPHDIVFFPMEEELAKILQVNEWNKNRWEHLIRELMEQYNNYRQQSIISLSIPLTDFNKLKEEIEKSLSYLIEEGYLLWISPKTYKRQFSDQLDKVHLSSSLPTKIDFSRLEIQAPFYQSFSFMEKELSSWKQSRYSSLVSPIINQMEKEWILFGALLYQNRFSIEIALDHKNAFEQLRNNLKESLDQKWIEYRQIKYPVLKEKEIFQTNMQVEKYDVKKKILMLSWEYPPNVIGGLGTHVAGLCESLIKQNYEIHLITAQDISEKPIDKEEKEGLFVYRIAPLYKQEQYFIRWIGGLNLSMWDKAVELSKHHTFSCIHAHDWLVGAAGISLKEQLDLPLITTIHATEHGRNGGIFTEMQKFIHEKESQLINRSDSIIVCSEFMQQEVAQVFQLPTNKMTIIPNGITAQSKEKVFSNSLERYEIDTTKTIVFSIGRLVKEKGFGTFLEAAKIMSASNSNLLFILAGVGPLEAEYKEYIQRNNLLNVLMLGYLSDEQKQALYHLADIAVVPSRYEPFGIVALESLVFAKPTIVSNTGGLKSIVEHRKTGLLMETGNVNSLVEQLQYLIENPSISEAIGQNGRKLVEQLFSWNRVGEETKRVFEEVLLKNKINETVLEVETKIN